MLLFFPIKTWIFSILIFISCNKGEGEELIDFGPKNFPKAQQLNINNFEQFKTLFKKTYKSSSEEEKRRNIFQKNKEEIERHNRLFEDGTTLYRQALSKFSDITYEELIASYTGFKMSDMDIDTTNSDPYIKFNSYNPEHFDWRSFGAVTPSRMQGNCGACWCFSAAGALEGAYYLETSKLVELSVQQLGDCTKSKSGSVYNLCNGGMPSKALMWEYHNGGMYTESQYPYTKKTEACRTLANKQLVAKMNEPVKIPNDEESIIEALITRGPLSAAYYMSARFIRWDWYTHPIYQEDDCPKDNPNHAVLLVGYGRDQDGTKYWTFKNSYGRDYGADGYFKMIRGVNMCGIENIVWSPTPPTRNCEIFPGCTLTGKIAYVQTENTIPDCNESCRVFTVCRGWTYFQETKRCFLMLHFQLQCGINGEGWISGTKGCSVRGNRNCPDGWKQFQNSCYKLLKERLTWEQASKECMKSSANLASVHSEGENNMLWSNLVRDSTWLGGFAVEGGWEDWKYWTWSWSDDSQWEYDNLRYNENDGKCVAIGRPNSRASWSNEKCSSEMQAVCKMIAI